MNAFVNSVKRICIVTPDTVGPVTNGGIGTHCYNLALFCAQQGHEVSLLFTGPCESGTKQEHKAFYATKGIVLLFLDDFQNLPYTLQLPEPLIRAAKVFHVLREQFFDQIHFQEWQANGFFCIQAKRTLGYFKSTLLAVTTHSSTEWIQEGMKQWNTSDVAGTMLMWAERYCVEHCDSHISPSVAMQQWLDANDWKKPARSCTVPYIFYAKDVLSYTPCAGVLAFFGRLETRKGLEIFCDGLLRLPPQIQNRITKILFVGKAGMCVGKPALQYIHEKLGTVFGCIETHCTLETFSAQSLLREQQALVFLPSLLDNLPFCGIECAVGRIPVLASNVGGFAEIFAAEQLFEPNSAGIAAAVQHYMENLWVQPDPVYQPRKAFEGWEEILQQKMEQMTYPIELQPLVSVCMPYFNHGAYLQAALESLACQNYPNFEVIVMDDGSTDIASKEIFWKLSKKFDSRFRFESKCNEGASITRNKCVNTYANGKYIVFCDADNIFEPQMLTTYVKAMEQSEHDILTCHFFPFVDVDNKTPSDRLHVYAPIGADLVSATLQNVLGDTNFIIQKCVFAELGGFKQTRDGYEDWDFLLRAVLTGKKLDVVPLPLFHYRVTKTGVNTTTSRSGNHRMVLESYKKYLPPYAYRALRDLLAPTVPTTLAGYENSVIVSSFMRCGILFETMYGRLCPSGSFLQRLATRVRYFALRFFPSGRS